jgi:ribonucleoside-triphosphate reductase
LTGIMDSKVTNGESGKVGFASAKDALKEALIILRETALATNIEFADYLDIEHSAAITCVKPSGTVSQLVDSASGIHPRYAPYYIRRVRLDKKDPLGKFMIDNGFAAEEDFYGKSNWVFSFPMKAPEGAVLVKDVNAIQQLELWKIYQESYCEHKPSITVYYNDEEYLDVGAWVYKNINNISGVSFLPRDTGSYRQAPYEEITKEQYEIMLKSQKQEIDWTSFKEETDNTENSKTLSCSAGVCEI